MLKHFPSTRNHPTTPDDWQCALCNSKHHREMQWALLSTLVLAVINITVQRREVRLREFEGPVK